MVANRKPVEWQSDSELQRDLSTDHAATLVTNHAKGFSSSCVRSLIVADEIRITIRVSQSEVPVIGRQPGTARSCADRNASPLPHSGIEAE